jgi:hypothetical protein
MTESFAGFSKSEWVRALKRAMPQDDAEAHVNGLFDRLATDPSNGFSLSSDTFALLSMVSAEAEERVARMLSLYPEAFRDQVTALVAHYRNEPQHGESTT